MSSRTIVTTLNYNGHFRLVRVHLSPSSHQAIVVMHDGFYTKEDILHEFETHVKMCVERLLKTHGLHGLRYRMVHAISTSAMNGQGATRTLKAVTPVQKDARSCGIIAIACLHCLLLNVSPAVANKWDMDTYRMGMLRHIVKAVHNGKLHIQPNTLLYGTSFASLQGIIARKMAMLQTMA
jgi:hypothetical protein